MMLTGLFGRNSYFQPEGAERGPVARSQLEYLAGHGPKIISWMFEAG